MTFFLAVGDVHEDNEMPLVTWLTSRPVDLVSQLCKRDEDYIDKKQSSHKAKI